MTQTTSFYLKVQRIEQVCLFELSWGRGLQLNATVPFPETLSHLYQDWISNYLSFYKTALRGRVADIGSIAPPPVDWHGKLVQSEAKLLYEFHHWLRRAELYEIRSRLAQAVKDREIENREDGENETSPPVEVFLTCNPLELERFPWEAWEIGTEFATDASIRIVRKPINVQGRTVTPKQRRRARILVILGDETGLNFQKDKEAVRSLCNLADVHFVGWQLGQNNNALKVEIVNTITDEQGWDILLFAGHSNETTLTGGELAIAPNACFHLHELKQPLILAMERGLQFALFNSCSGLSIANTLIDWGLSQVAVMREPIHNYVAQEFLVQFLQRLAEYKDVHQSLLEACQYLQLKKHLTYPSTYLIPSLFRHPDAPLFRLKKTGIWDKLKRVLPSKREAIALTALLCLSWQLPVQDFLLERRVLAQSQYRNLTNQVPTTQQPPVLVVQIDEQSIQRAKISDPKPMNRRYLAQIVDRLRASNAKVIGIDYLLDRHQGGNDAILAESVRKSVQQGTWFVFGTKRDNAREWIELLPELAHPHWALQGDVGVWGTHQIHMTLVPRQTSDPRSLPFSYLLALAHHLNFAHSGTPPQPQLESSVNWLSQLQAYVTDITDSNYREFFSPSSRLQPLTNFVYPLGQMWLHPIIDFSIPPEQVYQRIPAWQLLERPAGALQLNPQQQPIVIIAAGGYGEAGAALDGEDNFPVPPGLGYWRSQANPPDRRQILPGGEVHAYVIQHLLNRRIVVPIPDLWLVALAALLGKGTILALEIVNSNRQQQKNKCGELVLPSPNSKWLPVMAGATAVYGLASLQLYITTAVLLPIVLPVTMFWAYVLLNLFRKKSRV